MVFLIMFAEFINGDGKFIPEKFNAAQHTRVQKIHLGKNIECIVLQRRTAHAQTIFCIQQTGRPGYFAGRVFNSLAFIKHHIIKIDFHKQLYIAAQRAIGGNNNIVSFKMLLYSLRAIAAMVNMIGKLRGEFFDFIFPVKHQRGGTNHQRI